MLPATISIRKAIFNCVSLSVYPWGGIEVVSIAVFKHFEDCNWCTTNGWTRGDEIYHTISSMPSQPLSSIVSRIGYQSLLQEHSEEDPSFTCLWILMIDVSGCTWTMTPVLGDPKVTAFLKALSLHRFCWTCTPTGYMWPKIYLRWRHMSHHSIFERTGMQSLIRYGADVTLMSTVATQTKCLQNSQQCVPPA